MQEFLQRENLLRATKYAKDLDDEAFMLKLNEDLAELEKSLCKNIPCDIPNVFILGLPRSGTTLLYQVIAHTLRVAWPTNLMARFWDVPVIGMRLSRILGLFDRQIDFISEYGVTKDSHGPHEFGYFWMKWFGYPDVHIKDSSFEQQIDWEGMRNTIESISNEISRPVVYKNLIPGFHLNSFRKAQRNSLLVFVARDMADIAVSFLCARKRRYGNENVCWSFRPQDYERATEAMEAPEQIVYQVSSLSKMLAEQFNSIDRADTMVVKYDDICGRPMEIVGQLVQWFAKRGYEVDQKAGATPFVKRTYRDHALYDYFGDRLSSVNNLFDIR